MSDPTPTGSSEPSSSRFGCSHAIAWIAVALIAACTAVVFYMGDPVKKLMDKASQGFFTSEVEITGSQILLEIGHSHGDILEVASPLKTMESFHKSDNSFAAWGWVYLGTTTSEIKVPAHYRFHIKLSELQAARIDNGVLFITARAIYPSLPVAFDTAGMEKKADNTWLRFDANEQLAELEKSITPELAQRAVWHLPNIKEAARKDIEEFVQKWIVDTHPDYKKQVRAVKILFPGESPDIAGNPTPLP